MLPELHNFGNFCHLHEISETKSGENNFINTVVCFSSSKKSVSELSNVSLNMSSMVVLFVLIKKQD